MDGLDQIAEALSDQEVPTACPTFVSLEAFRMDVEARMWSDRSCDNECEFMTPMYLPFRKQKRPKSFLANPIRHSKSRIDTRH
jgi:hypothetical protein